MGSIFTDPPRPTVSLPNNPIHIWADVLGATLLILSFAAILTPTAPLPAQVPIHFGIDGHPDRFGSRGSLLFLPILLFAVYALLVFLGRHPNWHNYPVQVTDQNAPTLYRSSQNLLVVVRLHLAILSLGLGVFYHYLTQANQPLPFWPITLWLVSLLGNLAYGLIKMYGVQTDPNYKP